jgi:hypothetical protein
VTAEQTRARRRRGARQLNTWNRRLHFYLGLYFLLFLWLFSISGLLLNHPQWEFARSWPQREVTTSTQTIVVPGAAGDLAIAEDLMRQLDVDGEINQITRNADSATFRVQAGRPGRTVAISADFAAGHASMTSTRVHTRGVLDALHKFRGVSMNDPREQRDWVVTHIWSLAMDALAIGLIVVVLSGFYLWFRLRSRRRTGMLVLALGMSTCGFFLVGLALIF